MLPATTFGKKFVIINVPSSITTSSQYKILYNSPDFSTTTDWAHGSTTVTGIHDGSNPIILTGAATWSAEELVPTPSKHVSVTQFLTGTFSRNFLYKGNNLFLTSVSFPVHYVQSEKGFTLTLKTPISQQLSSALSSACDFKSHFFKQCGPRSDCSSRSSLIWVHIVCLYAKNRFEKFARLFSRRHKQTTLSVAGFLGVLRVKKKEFAKF